MLARTSLVSTLLLASLTAGCSWGRFSDILENGPVVFLEKPANLQSGFGPVMQAGTQDGASRLIVGGEHGTSQAAIYSIGKGETPNVVASRSDFCSNKATSKGTDWCFLAPQVAYLPKTTISTQNDEVGTGCIAVGISRAPTEENGVFFECENGSSFGRPVSNYGEYNEDVDNALKTGQDEPIAIATDGSEDPPVLVGAPTNDLAWYYEPSSNVPIDLLLPVDDEDLPKGFGTAVQALRIADSSWLFAVSAQGNDGELHLYRADGARPRYLGCLGGTPDFARKMTSGLVPGPDTPDIGDSIPDLVVSDRAQVYVFDGAKLADLPPVPTGERGYTCTLAALPENTLITSFGCGSTPATSECSSSDFGAALALGDIDGDGDNEVIVGAPAMTVRGEHGAGAILTYDVDTIGDHELKDVRSFAQGEGGDALGGSVSAVSIGDRDVIVGGAIRSGLVGLFYCSDMVPGPKRGKRCE